MDTNMNRNGIDGGFCTGCGKNCPLDNLQCGLGFRLAAEAAERGDASAEAPGAGERERGHGERGGHGHDHGHGHGHGGGHHHGGRGGHREGREGFGHGGRGGHGHHGHGARGEHGGRRPEGAPGREQGGAAGLTEDERLSRVLHHCARTLVHRERSQGGRASALAVLASHGAMSQAALAEKLDIRGASASELLAKMEADGLVTRTPDAEDGRAYRIELTEEGKAEARKIQQERKARDAELFDALDPAEKEDLTALLDKLASSWRQQR